MKAPQTMETRTPARRPPNANPEPRAARRPAADGKRLSALAAILGDALRSARTYVIDYSARAGGE